METNLSSIARYKTSYGYHRVLDIPWNTAVQRAQEALRAEGFGVLCEIDISQKLKEKLGIDFYRYLILGACNPPLARQALEEEPERQVVIKTTRDRMERVRARLRDLHPYELPEWIVLPAVEASAEYAEWVKAETAAPGT